MEIDENNSNEPNAMNDLEQSFLRQFNSMVTNDKHQLITKFYDLTKSSMSYDKARFFLEMSDWNLQLAVCNYFDMEMFPSFEVVDNVAPGVDGNVPVNQIFTKKWTVKNTDNLKSPKGVFTLASTTNASNQIESHAIPELMPGEHFQIQMKICVPYVGRCNDVYRLRAIDGTFLPGPDFTLDVNVLDEETFQRTYPHVNVQCLCESVQSGGGASESVRNNSPCDLNQMITSVQINSQSETADVLDTEMC